MKRLSKLLLVLLLLSAALEKPVSTMGKSEDEVMEKLLSAFRAVQEADEKGGDVSVLVEELNEALGLIELGGEAQLVIAEAKIDAVLEGTPLFTQAAQLSMWNHRMITGAITSVAVVLAIIVWRLGPRAFWSIWLRTKKGWRVHR